MDEVIKENYNNDLIGTSTSYTHFGSIGKQVRSKVFGEVPYQWVNMSDGQVYIAKNRIQEFKQDIEHFSNERNLQDQIEFEVRNNDVEGNLIARPITLFLGIFVVIGVIGVVGYYVVKFLLFKYLSL